MANSDQILALDIGGTKIGWATINVSGSPVIGERGSIPTLAERGGPDVARRIGVLVQESCANREYAAVAIASAGVVDPHTGTIVSATNTMPDWGGTELGTIVQRASGLRVRVLNDVHAHGLGEARLGAGRGHGSVLSVAVGTGIGGAHVMSGEIMTGARFLAGHVGHVHHHFARDMPCSCGRTGHIEGICSGLGIAAWYNHRRAAWEPPVSGSREVGELAQTQELARAVIVEAGEALGEVLGSLTNVLDPDVVVLTGSVTSLGARWWDSLRHGFHRSAMDPVSDLPILRGELGSDAPLLGAALNLVASDIWTKNETAR